jgi:hypothetical protein
MTTQKIFTISAREIQITKLKLKFPLLNEFELNLLAHNARRFNS